MLTHRYQPLGELPIGRHDLEFYVMVQESENRLLWSGTYTSTVEIVASLEEALPSVRSDAIDNVLMDSARFELSAGGREGALSMDLNPDDLKALSGIAFCLVVSLYQGDSPVGAWQPMVFGVSRCRRGHLFLEGVASSYCSRQLPDFGNFQELATLFFQIESSSREVLGLFSCDKRYAGSLRIPVSDVLQRK